MKNIKMTVLALVMLGSLVGLAACTRAGNVNTGESHVREETPEEVIQERSAQKDLEGEGLYTRDGDEHFTDENKGVGYEEGL